MKNNKIFIFWICLVVSFFLIFSCKKTDTENEGAVNQVYRDKTDCTGSTPTYTADIAPVLNSSCAISGCHNSQTRAHNLDLSNYSSTKGSFDLHSLICSISWDGCEQMPQGGSKLPDATIKKIICWSKNNYPQ